MHPLTEVNTHPSRHLQLIESAAAGAGRHILDLTRGLLDRGCEVHLIYSGLRANSTFRSELACLRDRSDFFVFELPMRRLPHWTDSSSAWKLRTYVRRHGPFDTAHFHSTKAGLIGRLALAGLGIPGIYTPHALYSMDPTGPFRAAAAVERTLANFCDRIILVSAIEFDHAVSIGLPRKKLQIISPGIDLSPSVSELRHRSRAKVQIGFVGRLARQKSPETLLRAFELVARTRCDVKLAMVGDGPLRKHLELLAEKLQISGRVEFAGEADGAAAMFDFDIFALTSRYEGFPYTILEAMAAGLPIVTTDVGGTFEAVQPGVNGFVAPIGDIAEIARALCKLVDDVDLRRRMGSESRRIVSQFSLDRMVDETLALYCKLAAARPQHEAHTPVEVTK